VSVFPPSSGHACQVVTSCPRCPSTFLNPVCSHHRTNPHIRTSQEYPSFYFYSERKNVSNRGRHGKDNKLIVWGFSEDDESSMSKVLPVDTPTEPRKQPWLLHILHVNTMNFCSFASSPASESPESGVSEELLIAVPNTLSSETVGLLARPPRSSG
jgi:hypothetical protein